MNVFSIFDNSSISEFRFSNISGLTYLSSWAKNNWYPSSDVEPAAIVRNREKSPSDFLPEPSAIFEGIEIADRLI